MKCTGEAESSPQRKLAVAEIAHLDSSFHRRRLEHTTQEVPWSESHAPAGGREHPPFRVLGRRGHVTLEFGFQARRKVYHGGRGNRPGVFRLSFHNRFANHQAASLDIIPPEGKQLLGAQAKLDYQPNREIIRSAHLSQKQIAPFERVR
jgi:hypothetical protein